MTTTAPAPVTRSLLGDRCQNHDTPVVVYPKSIGYWQAPRGSLRAWYRCPLCGGEWDCSFDMRAAGWTGVDVLCHGMDCRECLSEIRVTAGARGYRIRVIHEARCPWYPRYAAGILDPRREYTGEIPCGATVVHRGPYTRDPGLAGVIPLTPASAPDAA